MSKTGGLVMSIIPNMTYFDSLKGENTDFKKL